MAKRKIQVDDKWYVLAAYAHPEQPTQVLKKDATFAMFDRFGDIAALAPGQEGLFHNDTRYLSHLELTIAGLRPLYLGASAEQANSLLAIDLMNPDLTNPEIMAGGNLVLPKGMLHIFRAKLLWQGACYEHLRIVHHGEVSATIRLDIAFDGDFIDVFELRGMKRERRGERLPPEVDRSTVVLPYQGLDGKRRCTRVHFDPVPRNLDANRASFELRLDPGQVHHLYCTVSCECAGEAKPELQPYGAALAASRAERAEVQGSRCHLTTSNPLANLWFERSTSDLAMLTTELPSGPYPFAGVPWYCTTFGRDGIITALEYLWVDPSLARGVLSFLAVTQATKVEPERDAEPGKILHEARASEMAATGEIPFGRYYGTVDATPLFLVLAASYWKRTGDSGLLRSLWPHLLAAVEWIKRYGDLDGDGFVEYARKSKDGLTQQGWKDSQDSVFHADGTLAEAPIALCEVQGYVYQGKCLLGEVAHALGETELAATLAAEAHSLRAKFQSAFWSESLGTYALALDGAKKRCEVLSSNPGHCLWTGIAAPEHAQRIVDGFMGDAFFSGWGLRTIASGQPRYNPMSYHNGSIWPHDDALAALGMARYGRTEEAMRLFSALYEAGLHFEDYRLPELFCGFPRRHGAGPTLYPVACSPQAWAAAAPFALLQACLGLEIRGGQREIRLCAPRLPPFIDWLRLERLGLPGASCDLLLQRHERNVGVEVLRKDADVRVTVEA